MQQQMKNRSNLGGEKTRYAAYDLEKAADTGDNKKCREEFQRLSNEIDVLLIKFKEFQDKYEAENNLKSASGSA